jgi:hypothetical protein
MSDRVPKFQPCAPGDEGYRVRVLQELLVLANLGVKCDGQYGPATVAAVKAFQKREMRVTLEPTGVVDQPTFDALAFPFTQMERPMPDVLTTYESRLGEMLPRVSAWPIRELGNNTGPWTRYWMNGEENLAWCAGFATGVVKMAGAAVPYYWNCNDIYKWAADDRLPATPTYGDLFLVPRGDGTFRHVGIVAEVFDGGVIQTVEGNSNDDGSAEGNRVVSLFRNYKASGLVFVNVRRA